MNVAFFLLATAVPIVGNCSQTCVKQKYAYDEKKFEAYMSMVQPINNAIFNLINEAQERDIYPYLYPIIVELLEARTKLVDQMDFEQIDCRIPKKQSEIFQDTLTDEDSE